MITGKTISLRALTLEDKDRFYEWATNSDSTPYWYGDLYGEIIPDKKDFFADWTDEYFLDIAHQTKRSYAICLNDDEREIGQINYQLDKDEEQKPIIDIDIIIASDLDKGKGYGTEAIRLLTGNLERDYSDIPFTIYALTKNLRAIRSYSKAGFRQDKIFSDDNGNEWVKLIKVSSYF